jgi:hypothetical protein
LLIKLSCSPACLAILTACLDRISFVWATFYTKNKVCRQRQNNQNH